MEDSSSFFNYMRIEPLMFDVILNRVGPSDTNFRRALEPGLNKSLVEVWQKCQGCLCLNSTVATKRMSRS